MFGLNYSTKPYSPGKLVDEDGQGSSNDSYGRTLPVTAAEQIDLYLPHLDVPYGSTRSNATPLLRAGDLVLAAFGAAAFFSGYSRVLGGAAMGLAAASVIARHASPNLDSAVSMVPLNERVI